MLTIHQHRSSFLIIISWYASTRTLDRNYEIEAEAGARSVIQARRRVEER